MLSLVEVVHQLAQNDEVVIKGEVYKVKNVVMATDGDVLKARFILENKLELDHIAIDVDISARLYKR